MSCYYVVECLSQGDYWNEYPYTKFLTLTEGKAILEEWRKSVPHRQFRLVKVETSRTVVKEKKKKA